MAHFHGRIASTHYHGDGTLPVVVPTIGTVMPGDTSVTFTYSGPATHSRVFPLAGSPGAWVPIGPSPVTITGLTGNTEHRLQISGDGSTVADFEDFGTNNSGGGGGTFPSFGDATVNLGFTVRAGGFTLADLGYRVSAAGSAVVSTSFSIQESASRSLNTGYPVRSAGLATLNAGFEVVSTISGGVATLPAGYAVAAASLATLSVGYSVGMTAGSATLTTGYAVQGAALASLDVGYLVAFTGSRTLAAGYLVESAGISTTNIKMTLRPRISITLRN